MVCCNSKVSRALFVVAFVVPLLLPAIGWAGWGDEKWGEMIWGGGAPSIPSLPLWGRIALVILLAIVPGGLLARRHRTTRA
jgi:hypothetical protein